VAIGHEHGAKVHLDRARKTGASEEQKTPPLWAFPATWHSTNPATASSVISYFSRRCRIGSLHKFARVTYGARIHLSRPNSEAEIFSHSLARQPASTSFFGYFERILKENAKGGDFIFGQEGCAYVDLSLGCDSLELLVWPSCNYTSRMSAQNQEGK